MRKSFVLYTDIYEAVTSLPFVAAGELFKMILEYEREEKIGGEYSREAMTAFNFIKPNLDRNNKKYDAICKRNRENIKKRWEKHIPAHTKNTSGKTGIPEILDNDNDIKEIYKEKKYLLNIPDNDIAEMVKKFNMTPQQIKACGESAHDWLLAEGKVKKDYKAFLRNWLRKSYSPPPKPDFSKMGVFNAELERRRLKELEKKEGSN